MARRRSSRRASTGRSGRSGRSCQRRHRSHERGPAICSLFGANCRGGPPRLHRRRGGCPSSRSARSGRGARSARTAGSHTAAGQPCYRVESSRGAFRGAPISHAITPAPASENSRAVERGIGHGAVEHTARGCGRTFPRRAGGSLCPCGRRCRAAARHSSGARCSPAAVGHYRRAAERGGI